MSRSFSPQVSRTDAPVLARHTLRHADGRCLHVYGELRGRLPESAGTVATPALHRRRDPFTDSWVAVSPGRNQRPQTRLAADTRRSGCPLCPGGPEVPFSYDAAVFDNRFPSFMPQPPPVAVAAGGDGLEDVAPSVGRCEVVLYTEEHCGSLASLEPAQVARIVAVWRDRSQALWADPRHAFVLIFENRGEAVGATLSHPHGQIYAFDHLPPSVHRRVAALRVHRDRDRACLSCRVVRTEAASGRRRVADNDSFLVSVPFAPRWPYEVHVRALRHGARRLADLDAGEQRDLAAALRDVVLRYDQLYGVELPYMMVAQEAPAEQPDWHLSFEFFPPHRGPDKLKVRASVETATGLFVNDTVPETSAAELRALPVPVTDWSGVAVPRVEPSGQERS